MIIKEEIFTVDNFNRVTDCLKDYKKEASSNPWDIDVDIYGMIGSHTVYAEDNGKIVGFCVVKITYHPHHKKELGYVDAWYVRPDYRGTLGVKLIKRTEEYLKGLGVLGLVISYSVKNDISKLMGRLGYNPTEIVTLKEL